VEFVIKARERRYQSLGWDWGNRHWIALPPFPHAKSSKAKIGQNRSTFDEVGVSDD
jgi:hypothetical protein